MTTSFIGCVPSLPILISGGTTVSVRTVSRPKITSDESSCHIYAGASLLEPLVETMTTCRRGVLLSGQFTRHTDGS